MVIIFNPQCFPPGADMIDALDFYFQVKVMNNQ